jgi:hypothetical protein
MKRLSILLMLVVLIGVSAFAQTSRKSYVHENLGVPKKSLLGDSRPTVCDTFVNLCDDDTLVYYSASCDGVIPAVMYADTTALVTSRRRTFSS